MEVHICTFKLKLSTVKVNFTPKSTRQTLEAVWRGEKGQVIVVGAARPIIKNSIASFEEPFQIKTDLIRDPISNSYLPSTLALQIRNAGKALSEKISGSVCKLSLPYVLINSQLVTVQLQAEDRSFVANLEAQCVQIINSGLRKSSNKLARKLSKQKQISQLDLEKSSRLRSKQGKSRSRSGENVQNEIDFYEKSHQELLKLKDQLKSEQANHIVTSQALRNVQQQLIQHEHVINQLSAMISQRETDIIQLNQQIDNIKQEFNELKKQNQAMKSYSNEVHLLEVKNSELQQHILECQRQVEQLKHGRKELNEKEKELKSTANKQKQINIFLSKSLDQLKKDLSRKQQEVNCLSNISKANETERDTIKEELNLLKQKHFQVQRQIKQDLSQSHKKFNQLYQQYCKLKEQNSALSNMITFEQVQERQKNYELKIQQFQQKQLNLKEHVQAIERQMIDLEDILQEKEDNQFKLVQHSRKLQLQIERLEVQKNMWLKIFPKDELQFVNDKGASQETQALKKKIDHLLLILKVNSSAFLESQRNKRQLMIMQKQHKQAGHRLSLLRDQSKQLKQRVTVLLKENKKLIEKMHKIQKESQLLHKNNRLLTKQLKKGQQKQSKTAQDYQILNYRMSLLQKQLSQLKSTQKDQLNLKHFTQNYQIKSIDGDSGMGIIRQMSQQFVSSRPHSRKGTVEIQRQQVKVFSSQPLHDLAILLSQRQQIVNKFCVKMEGNIKNGFMNQRKYQQLYKQSSGLTKLMAQVKRHLIHKGQRQVAIRCQQQAKKVLLEVNKLQMEQY